MMKLVRLVPAQYLLLKRHVMAMVRFQEKSQAWVASSRNAVLPQRSSFQMPAIPSRSNGLAHVATDLPV